MEESSTDKDVTDTEKISIEKSDPDIVTDASVKSTGETTKNDKETQKDKVISICSCSFRSLRFDCVTLAAVVESIVLNFIYYMYSE